MILWLNGTAGVSKTPTVAHLLPLPRQRTPWPPWRRLVVAAVCELHDWTGQHLLCPETVLHRDYWLETAGGLAEQGRDVVPVLLDAPTDVLRKRIEASGEAVEWRLEHLAGR